MPGRPASRSYSSLASSSSYLCTCQLYQGGGGKLLHVHARTSPAPS